jgi:hypothetical protein
MQEYKPEDVFNCDETGCQFRAKPCRTLDVTHSSGMKISKDRFTVMLACSSTGEKLMPLIIHTARAPHTFKRERFNPENYWSSPLEQEGLDDWSGTISLSLPLKLLNPRI